MGVHYNYDTYESSNALASQIRDLQSYGFNPITGRAHYLRFGYPNTFNIISECGVRGDETVGFYSFVGFRTEVAGVYQPYDPISKCEFDLKESPLYGMDQAMIEDYEAGFLETKRMLSHLQVIWRQTYVLFHHDYFNNPSTRRLLDFMRRYSK